MTENRGFGLEIENKYGDTTVAREDFDLDWWNQANDVDFKLNDDPVVINGSSRMNRKARAGVMKPTGSTSADADLQQLGWYFYGYLDNYIYTAGESNVNVHEFYGGECKELPSFRGIAVYDMLKKYLYGLLLDQLKLEVSNENMSVGGEWIYKTEKAGIIGVDDETFEQPDMLTNEELFIMFYDVLLYLNNKRVDDDEGFGGVATAFTFDGNNNHDVDGTIGLGSRYPKKRACAGKRENSLSVTTSLTADTVRSILDAQYGEVGALEPTSCKLLQIPLKLEIRHCEDTTLGCDVIFPKCTVKVEYNLSGVDLIEATISLDTLGTGTVTLLDNTEVATDMYVKLMNNQEELGAVDSNNEG